MQQTKFLVTERQSNVPCSEAAFGDFQRALAYPDRFGHVIGRAQSIKLVIEDSPKVLLAFHGESPTFTQLGHKMGRELLGRQGQGLSLVGRNVSPNEKTGGAHHFGVGKSEVPLRVSSLYLTCMVRLNSVVARTFPRTDRAGVRLISRISAFTTASALSFSAIL